MCPKKDNCAYWHPSELVINYIIKQCKKFPHCKYGDQCLYIHPQVSCKFGANCNRPNCAYTHPPQLPVQYFNPPAYMPYMPSRPRPKNLKLVLKPKSQSKTEPNPENIKEE